LSNEATNQNLIGVYSPNKSPKMMSWKFPSLITVKEAIMTLVDKLSNDSVI